MQRFGERAASSRDQRLGVRLQRHGAGGAEDSDAVEGSEGSGRLVRSAGLRDRWPTGAGSECFVKSAEAIELSRAEWLNL